MCVHGEPTLMLQHALHECVTMEMEEHLRASMARHVFDKEQVQDEELRMQCTSIVEEERARQVGQGFSSFKSLACCEG
jgi:hypothetical protein